jgi:ribonuclease G
LDILIEELEGSVWVAALLDGKLEGFEVDPTNEEVRWGSIYWAKVKSVDASMDAAYLDLDGENIGLLFNKDVRLKDKKGKITKGGEKAIGKIFRGGDMVAVQAKTAYLSKLDDDHITGEKKFPRMSMDITLPGRHIIHCVMMNENKISSRIRDKKTREQLADMLDSIKGLEGCILRASALNTQTDILTRECTILQEAWDKMQKYMDGDEVGLIMLGPDAVQRTLSDQAAHTIDTIEVVTMEHFNNVEEWCSIFAPDLVTKIEPVELENAEDDLALFEYRDIIGQIEDIFDEYTILPGGGNIIIQETAALTSIDVNKGSDKSSHANINIEAAQEIARQIRLRNMGGIIVIDFLKMSGKKDQDRLLTAMEKALGDDPCTVQMHGLTHLGLMELTRARRTPPLLDRFDGVLE